MESKTKMKTCRDKDCENQFKPFVSTQKYCSYSCTRKNNKKAANRTSPKNKPTKKAYISQVSKKKLMELREYARIRKEFLSRPENKLCPVLQCPAVEVHHKKGRIGYADKWARDNGITLLVDVRFFLAVSRKGHRYIEENPGWAYSRGYSLSRHQIDG